MQNTKSMINDLKLKIELTDKEIEKLKNQRNALQSVLELYERQRQNENPTDIVQVENVSSNNGHTMTLTEALMKSLNIEGKTLEALKKDIRDMGIDLGENQGRAIHTALYGLSQKGITEKIDGHWKKKTAENKS